jgi:hypothetical protein
VIKKHRERGGHSPRCVAMPEKIIIINIVLLRDIVFLRNICINALHKGDSYNNNNNNNIRSINLS